MTPYQGAMSNLILACRRSLLLKPFESLAAGCRDAAASNWEEMVRTAACRGDTGIATIFPTVCRGDKRIATSSVYCSYNTPFHVMVSTEDIMHEGHHGAGPSSHSCKTI